MANNDVTVMQPKGELNAVTSGSFKAELVTLSAEGSRRILVDLSGVSFIDSSGLGALLAGLKSAKLQGGELALAAIAEPARVIFAITMADKLFPIFPSVEEGLAFLGAQPPLK